MKRCKGEIRFLLCLAALAVGCSAGKDKWVEQRLETFPVTGTVTYNGEPIEGAIVVFQSQVHDIGAFGATDEHGRFIMRTYTNGDGAVAGEHRVRIMKRHEDMLGDPDSGRLVEKVTMFLPPRYDKFETSGLSATVSEGDENSLQFDLVGNL